jgi:hypothetical protein
MTLAPRKEHAMTAKPEQQSPPVDIERFRQELDLKIQRLVAESLEAWATCEDKRCRRAKRCVSLDRECIAKSQESLPSLSPEEAAQRLADFRRDLDMRIAGLPLDEPSAKAKKSRGNKSGSTPATGSAQGDNDREALAPAAEETQLAPKKQERIDRAWNDYVKEQDKAREPGPRITQL